ncbi:hypothetical protein [Paucibacter sp. KBW04]|uniref:hypothetical protein n=1 Tax=Paucibacter sp. KBW04 TaxID=2153361 RepID=UPI000F57DA5B|nr:hypothetical protein [Paucibacter sp. KBW04]
MNYTETNPYWARLEQAMASEPPVIVPHGRDPEAYFEELRRSIRENATADRLVSAVVVEPGFSHRSIGSIITGHLLASSAVNGQVGYWLVYEAEEDEYYCFWGNDVDSLAAYGVVGNPIYCWWA